MILLWDFKLLKKDNQACKQRKAYHFISYLQADTLNYGFTESLNYPYKDSFTLSLC